MLPAILLLLLHLASAQPSFNYTSFSNVEANSLNLSGNATIFDGQLRLTSDNFFSYGRAVWSQKINFCEDSAFPLSFTTDFTFHIHSKSNQGNADGLAFFIAPSLKPPSNESYGRWLGLLNPVDNGKLANKLVAVEFDTCQNQPPDYPGFQDMDGNHVGVDVNEMISQNASSLGIRLGERSLAARIDYNATVQKMSVYVSTDLSFTSMESPVLQHSIKLCQYINSSSYIGLSAGSGSANVDFHNISSWKFSGRYTDLNISTSSLPRSNIVNSTNSRFKIPFVVTLSVAGILIVLLGYSIFLRRTHVQAAVTRKPEEKLFLQLRAHEIKYSDIVQATHRFSEGNLLGRGGFGSVYKGILPEDNSAVAVKRVSEKSDQGEREFLAEVKIISRLSHRNLVKLRGWCRKNNELILVYEFMEQGSVEQALFRTDGVLLLWSTRYKIISGLAAALVYLHEEWEQQVLHRDIKCSNVMLDADFNARLGDFGLARVLERDNKSRTTNVAGTIGYIAPEVGCTYKFTPASDVYSFGVVVLEIVCGKKVVGEEMLLMPWVEGQVEAGKLLGVVDPRLHEQFDPVQVAKVLQMALACVDSDPKNRLSMRHVVNLLG